MPTLVSTLAISCVFTSVVFLDGPAKYLFTPLGLAVVFAMLASYALSRTLTPITIGLLLKSERHEPADAASSGWFSRIHRGFERGFERLRRSCAAADLAAPPKVDCPDHRHAGACARSRDVPAGRPRFLSRPSTVVRSNSMSGRRPAPGSKPRRASFRRWRTRSARLSPKANGELIVDNIGLPARLVQPGIHRRLDHRRQ